VALLPPFFLSCVVALGNKDQSGNVSWVATGFFYGSPIDDGRMYRTYLVTNRHVAETLASGVVRLNSPAGAPAREFNIAPELGDGSPSWILHPDPTVDVAASPVGIDFTAPENSEIGFVLGDKNSLSLDQIRQHQLQEGDFVYLLGFPMGLVGPTRSAVIVRSGLIARLRDLLDGSSNNFLVDSWVFPGNSGGMVVTRPETTAIQGTKSHDQSHVIGVVASYIPYQDVAVSQQTGRPRIVFEENSGLATVFPIDFVQSMINEWEIRYPLADASVPVITEVDDGVGSQNPTI
jgi:S1-C subfamily serine protease